MFKCSIIIEEKPWVLLERFTYVQQFHQYLKEITCTLDIKYKHFRLWSPSTLKLLCSMTLSGMSQKGVTYHYRGPCDTNIGSQQGNIETRS